MDIRIAKVADAEGIAKIQIESWRFAYKNIIDDGILSNLNLRHKTEIWQSVLKNEDWSAWVAVNPKKEIEGFIHLCGYRDNDLPSNENVGEISAIYINPKLVGRGVGATLMQKGIESLEKANHRKIALWVLSKNDLAINFYEKFGFASDGGVKKHPSTGLTEVRYVYQRAHT